MRNEGWIGQELRRLEGANLLRRLAVRPEAGGKIRLGDHTCLNFSSNDYLNLSRHPHVLARADEMLRRWGAGATGSRLMTGTFECHEELERRLASFKGCAAALAFGCGYAANVGAIPALVGRADTVFADRLVHASIVDAIVLSRARLVRFHHNDADHLRTLLRNAPAKGRRLVVTESVFSMDGDVAPLKDIAEIAGGAQAMLMVDEAHATGVFGPAGSGVARSLGLEAAVNLSMGTLSKALGAHGGFIACSEPMREWLVNKARSFIYSTALPPASVGAALGALDVLERDPNIGARLLERAAEMRSCLQAAGLNTGNSASQIIPVLVGESGRALSVSARLMAEGILAVPIREPTVPRGSARLRFSVTLAQGTEDVRRAAAAVAAALKAEGVMA